MIGIITDSASDTPVELIRNEGIEVVPLKIFLGDKEYKDAVEATEEMCLDYMKTDFAKTSGTPYPFVREGFERLIAKGIREIIAINVSNNISNGHSVFKVVAEELKKVYEDLKVEIVDTLSISIGSGLLVCKAAELRAEGYTLEKMANVLRAYVPQDLDVYYVVPTLKYLKAGGRIGKVSDISKRLDLSNSTVSGIIERLVKKGVVERKRSEEDRRIVMISLTEEHRRDFKLHFDLLKKKMESVMTIGTEKDIDFILTALKKLKAILEEAQKYEKEGEKECLN